MIDLPPAADDDNSNNNNSNLLDTKLKNIFSQVSEKLRQHNGRLSKEEAFRAVLQSPEGIATLNLIADTLFGETDPQLAEKMKFGKGIHSDITITQAWKEARRRIRVMKKELESV